MTRCTNWQLHLTHLLQVESTYCDIHVYLITCIDIADPRTTAKVWAPKSAINRLIIIIFLFPQRIYFSRAFRSRKKKWATVYFERIYPAAFLCFHGSTQSCNTCSKPCLPLMMTLLLHTRGLIDSGLLLMLSLSLLLLLKRRLFPRRWPDFRRTSRGGQTIECMFLY